MGSHRDARVETIRVGPDKSWSDTLLLALKQVSEPLVFLWIDDHFLIKQVNTRSILHALEDFVRLHGNYLRFHPLPRPDTRMNSHFGAISPREVYRTATVASVWRKDALLALLKSGESAWEFEVKGSARSDRFDGFFGVWREHFKIENLMIKGKLRRVALRRVQRILQKPLATSKRVMSRNEEIQFQVAILGNRLLIRLLRPIARPLSTLS